MYGKAEHNPEKLIREVIGHQGYRKLCAMVGFPVEAADTIIGDCMKQAGTQSHPVILHMLGIPGSGKSTFVRQLEVSNTLVLGCDDVMEKIPGYQVDKAAQGNEAAFAKWELCAREITYEILFCAVEKRLNIVFDHGGSRPEHLEMLKKMKWDAGYRVTVIAMFIDEELALKRAATRDRSLPPGYIPVRKKAIEELLPGYRAVADDYVEYMATSSGNVLVVQSSAGRAKPAFAD